MVSSSGICEIGISDHSLVYFQRKSSRLKSPARFITARSLKNFDENAFVTYLSGINWDNVLLCDDPDDAWFQFKVTFNEVLDIYAPLKKMKIRGKLPDWMNHDFVALTELRDDRKRTFNRTRSEADGEAY